MNEWGKGGGCERVLLREVMFFYTELVTEFKTDQSLISLPLGPVCFRGLHYLSKKLSKCSLCTRPSEKSSTLQNDSLVLRICLSSRSFT